MKEINCDILVVGSGMTGLLTAYAISSFGYKIVIVDQKRMEHKNIKTDSRTTAISEGSKVFFEKIGFWKKISSYTEPIKKIKVIDRKPKNNINFFNYQDKRNLGYIVRNYNIISLLIKLLKKNKNITFYDNFKILRIDYTSEKVVGVFKNLNVSADILIAADGKNSSVRNLLRVPLFKKIYSDSALVLTLNHLFAHNSTAYEIFYKTGPLAILPMKSKKNKHSSSIVWSNNPLYLKSLFEEGGSLLKETLNEKISEFIGPVQKILTKQMFPLSSHINRKFYSKRVLFIGDSAHSIHPIAGQGWNLGVKDIKNLYDLTNDHSSLGLSLGSNNFCKEYNENSYYNAFQLYQITDKLNAIFKKNNLSSNGLRSIGFSFIEKNNNLKKIITNFAMGFS